MTLKDRIDRDYKHAFKLRNKQVKNLLGVLKGEIANEESRGTTMDDDAVVALIRAMVKSLTKMNTDEAREEIVILDTYLPQMMSEEDIIKLLEQNFYTPETRNIKSVMQFFNRNFKGHVDNRMLSTVAKKFFA